MQSSTRHEEVQTIDLQTAELVRHRSRKRAGCVQAVICIIPYENAARRDGESTDAEAEKRNSRSWF